MRHALVVCLALIASLVVAGTTRAAERILDYHADITIAADASMQVAETIRVQAEGVAIRHGIYRDFPTDYRDRQHNRVHIDFRVLDATLDGATVDWRTERRDNGVRVYLGSAATTLTSGVHTFVIHYTVNRELGFFADHDELFWNVNGTGWDFAVDHISATVHLPGHVAATDITAFGYTGAQGSREAAIETKVADSSADFTATRALAPHENLSIVTTFPKGVVAAPTSSQKLGWFFTDNRNVLYGLLGLIVLWLYYGLAWQKHGRDPKPGPLVAAYEPPDGASAAALHYVRRMGFDNTTFTAGILGLAAKGALTITHLGGKTWTASRLNDANTTHLAPEESALLTTLFADGPSIEFNQDEHARIRAARDALKAKLASSYRNRFFRTNTVTLLPGVAITVVAAWFTSRDGSSETLGMLLWLAMWTFGAANLVVATWKSMHEQEHTAIGLWFMTVVFVAAEVAALIFFTQHVGLATLLIFVALILTNFAFYQWMKAPTAVGQRFLDGINGFRWYLGVAEKQELDARYQPNAHPELFAEYLPYALALGVGNAWAQRFADALSPAQMTAATPGWYHGMDGSFTGSSLAGFTSSLSSGLGGAIASSSAAPGSSGGAGGGSGGGGGGGGGGGW